jgi:hypothetical protein
MRKRIAKNSNSHMTPPIAKDIIWEYQDRHRPAVAEALRNKANEYGYTSVGKMVAEARLLAQ